MKEEMTDTDFEQLVLRIRPRLLSTAETFVRSGQLSQADAEDAVQNTLVKLWRMSQNLGDCRNVEAMATVMMRNTCIDVLRSVRKNNVDIGLMQIMGDSSADASIAADNLKQAIGVLISRLPKTQRRLLLLRSEGMSLDDIAATCAMPKTSVKTLIAKARRTLLCGMKGLR